MALARLPSNRFDFEAHPDGIWLRPLQDAVIAEGPTINDWVTIVVIEAGEGALEHGNRSCRAGPGSVFVIATGEAHDALGLVGLRGWALSFVPAGARSSCGAR